MTKADVITKAKLVAYDNWTAQTDVSPATVESGVVTKIWQEYFVKMDAKRFSKDVKIAEKMNEEIDLVDYQENVAYELKVSGKNPHHEFYKDLFKVLVFNQSHKQIKLNTLVFITEGKGIEKLEKGLGKVAADFLQQFNIKVEFAKLN